MKGTIIDVTQNVSAVLGWSAADLLGTPLTRIIPERFHGAHREGFQRFIHSGEMPLEGQTVQLPALHSGGGEVVVDLRLERPQPGARAVAVGTIAPAATAESARSELAAVVQQAVAQDLPLEELIEQCVGVAASRDNWAIATVWWIDPWMTRLRAIATWAAAPVKHQDYIDHIRTRVFARGEGMVGGVWDRGVHAFFSDGGEPASVRGSDGAPSPFRSGFLFPLSADGQMVGVVEMLDDRRREFSTPDHEAVWLLSDEIGRLVADRLRREHDVVRQKRIQLALASASMGVWSHHIPTGITAWDEHLENLHGLEPGTFGGSVDDVIRYLHPADRDETLRLLASAVEGGREFNHTYRAVRADGSVMWLQTVARTVHDVDENLQALTGVSFDITDRVEAQAQLDTRMSHAALAADVGRALVSTAPVEDRLRVTAEAVVDRLGAAFARIWTLDQNANLLRLQASAGLYTHLDGAHAVIRVGDFKIGRIASTRQPHLTNAVLDDPLISDRDWAAREGMVAFAGYPLIVGDQLVGVLGLFAGAPLPESTLQALAAIADTIAIAVLQERATIEMEATMRDRARVAEILQSSLLPPSLPEIEGLSLSAAYLPGADEVGGDFYDVFPARSGWGFVIGDVCGRGPEAARLTALARHTLRTTLLLDLSPKEALTTLNEAMVAGDDSLRFCTAVCGVMSPLDQGGFEIVLAVGGHPPPLVMRRNGAVEPVHGKGSLLGVLSEPSHVEVDLRLDPGDALVLYTDGVIEARQGTDLFGESRLRSLLEGLNQPSTSEVVALIVSAVREHSPGADDDLAVFVMAARLE